MGAIQYACKTIANLVSRAGIQDLTGLQVTPELFSAWDCMNYWKPSLFGVPICCGQMKLPPAAWRYAAASAPLFAYCVRGISRVPITGSSIPRPPSSSCS